MVLLLEQHHLQITLLLRDQWGKTRTKNPDGTASQLGPFPPHNGNVDLELWSVQGLKERKKGKKMIFMFYLYLMINK